MRTPSVKQSDHKDSSKIARHTLIHSLLDIVFPRRCAGDHDWSDTLFCNACRSEQKFILSPLCACCGQPFNSLAQVLPDSICANCRANRYHRAPHIDMRRAPFEHVGPIREAIHSFKYQGKTALAQPLAELLWKYSRDQSTPNIPYEQLSFITSIPLHTVRHWRRGYNQSALLARHLSHFTGISYKEFLKRTRRTRPQTQLNAKHRAANVAGAFALLEEQWLLENKVESVLLIDDVATTGATLEECARVLKKNGVREVYALTLARRD